MINTISKLHEIAEIYRGTEYTYAITINGKLFSKYVDIQTAYKDYRLYKQTMPTAKIELVEL